MVSRDFDLQDPSIVGRDKMGNPAQWYPDPKEYSDHGPNIGFGSIPVNTVNFNLQANLPNRYRNPVHSIQNNLSKVQGSHSLKAGIHVERTYVKCLSAVIFAALSISRATSTIRSIRGTVLQRVARADHVLLGSATESGQHPAVLEFRVVCAGQLESIAAADARFRRALLRDAADLRSQQHGGNLRSGAVQPWKIAGAVPARARSGREARGTGSHYGRVRSGAADRAVRARNRRIRRTARQSAERMAILAGSTPVPGFPSDRGSAWRTICSATARPHCVPAGACSTMSGRTIRSLTLSATPRFLTRRRSSMATSITMRRAAARSARLT